LDGAMKPEMNRYVRGQFELAWWDALNELFVCLVISTIISSSLRILSSSSEQPCLPGPRMPLYRNTNTLGGSQAPTHHELQCLALD
jgi:hypothetical protein